MRHLVLALPLLALSAACAEPCTAPALTVSWRFALADGTRDATCQAAGVATVDLWIDGTEVGAEMACDQGAATFTGLDAGSHSYTIQGRAGDGTLRYQTWGLVPVDRCGETRAVLQPGAGYLRVAYETSTGLCYAEGDPAETLGYVWYTLLDRTTNLTVSSVNAVQSPALLPCQTGAQAEVNVPVPWGLYRLRWIQIVTFPLATNPTPIYQYCPPLDPPPVPTIDVSVTAPGVTTLAVPMAPPTTPCIP